MTSIGNAIGGSLIFTIVGAIFAFPLFYLIHVINYYMALGYGNNIVLYQTFTIGLAIYVFVSVVYGALFFATMNKAFNDYYGWGGAFKSAFIFLAITFMPFLISLFFYVSGVKFTPFSAWEILINNGFDSAGYLSTYSAGDMIKGIFLKILAFAVYAPFFLAGIIAGMNRILFDIGGEEFDDYEY